MLYFQRVLPYGIGLQKNNKNRMDVFTHVNSLLLVLLAIMRLFCMFHGESMLAHRVSAQRLMSLL